MNKKAQFFPLGDDNPVSKFTFVNWCLILANVIVFVVSLSAFDETIKTFGFTPGYFSLLTMFTSMFLHGGLAHIAGNMWFLFIFGDNIEDKLGHIQYLGFYLLGGIAASISHFLTDTTSLIPAVGASGAISAVLGAYLVFYPNADVFVSGSIGQSGRVKAVFMLGMWFVFQLISGTMSLFGESGGIAFFAHIGGFVFGALIALIIKQINK